MEGVSIGLLLAFNSIVSGPRTFLKDLKTRVTPSRTGVVGLRGGEGILLIAWFALRYAIDCVIPELLWVSPDTIIFNELTRSPNW